MEDGKSNDRATIACPDDRNCGCYLVPCEGTPIGGKQDDTFRLVLCSSHESLANERAIHHGEQVMNRYRPLFFEETMLRIPNVKVAQLPSEMRLLPPNRAAPVTDRQFPAQ
jgi:hypothetical protein